MLGLSRTHGAIALWVVLQGCSSVGLIMCNRYLALYLHQSILTLMFQNLFATLLSLTCWAIGVNSKPMNPWKLQHFFRVIPLACLFSLLLFTSFRALSFVSVATIVVFRNSSPFFTAVADRFVNGTIISSREMFILIMLIVGAFIFSYDDITFSVVGYGWGFANLLCNVVAGMFGKSFAMGLKQEQTALGLSCYQNIVSVFTLTTLSAATGEIWEWPGWNLFSYLTAMDSTARGVFLMSCLWCVTMGIATFELQRLVPQTTVTVCNVTYKMITLFVNAVVFGNNVGFIGLFGLVIAQASACVYMYERMKGALKKDDNASQSDSASLGETGSRPASQQEI